MSLLIVTVAGGFYAYPLIILEPDSFGSNFISKNLKRFLKSGAIYYEVLMILKEKV